MPDIITKRFEQADEVREFELGRFDIVHLAGVALGRAEYAPGWRWTTHVGAITGEALCQVEHVCLVLEGHAAVRMADGTERVFGPGDAFYVPPGHDSWVVGDKPYVSLHLLGTTDYAQGDVTRRGAAGVSLAGSDPHAPGQSDPTPAPRREARRR